MKAYILSLNREANLLDQWDFGFLLNFIEKNNFEIQDVSKLPKDETAIVALPARHHKGLEDQVNEQLANIDNPVLFLMGDEEAEFDVSKITNSKHIWVQNPHPGKHDDYNKLGTGYPTHMGVKKKDKDLDMYFAGQVTHDRRRELTDVMMDMSFDKKWDIHLVKTRGFTQGDPPDIYYDYTSRAKVMPCPSGAVIPDSFRFFEALESMAIPIADNKTPSGEVMNYWDWMFGNNPIPQVVDWERLWGLLPELLEDYPRNMHQITAWYIRYKRDFKNKVLEQLNG